MNIFGRNIHIFKEYLKKYFQKQKSHHFFRRKIEHLKLIAINFQAR